MVICQVTNDLCTSPDLRVPDSKRQKGKIIRLKSRNKKEILNGAYYGNAMPRQTRSRSKKNDAYEKNFSKFKCMKL